MTSARESRLRLLNIEMAAAETRGDRQFFEALLAPAFAFLRASGAFEDRATFLAGLRPGDERTCVADSITVLPIPERRALVTCLVSMATRDGHNLFHNARLFVLDGAGAWRLLAWANEVAGPG